MVMLFKEQIDDMGFFEESTLMRLARDAAAVQVRLAQVESKL